MADVRLLPLGVGNAFSALHYTTCMALGAGDDWILIDCPHPVRKMLREAAVAAGLNLDLGNLSAMLLSHLHGDHASGLEDYAYFHHFMLGRRARLLTHPEVSERLWENLLRAGMGFHRDAPDAPEQQRSIEKYFEITSLEEDRPTQVGPFSVECRRTHHPIATTAFRISAHGRVFGFSADTAYDPTLIDWLSAADLIVHEVTPLPSSNAHTPYQYLAALPASLRARIRLNHYPDDFAPPEGTLELLRQGTLYPV